MRPSFSDFPISPLSPTSFKNLLLYDDRQNELKLQPFSNIPAELQNRVSSHFTDLRALDLLFPSTCTPSFNLPNYIFPGVNHTQNCSYSYICGVLLSPRGGKIRPEPLGLRRRSPPPFSVFLPMAETLHNAPIVLDNGSGTIRAGFAGEDLPKCYFP